MGFLFLFFFYFLFLIEVPVSKRFVRNPEGGTMFIGEDQVPSIDESKYVKGEVKAGKDKQSCQHKVK